MSLTHVDDVAVFYEPDPASRKKVGRLVLRNRMIYFEYAAEFLGSRLELSPFHLRLGPGVTTGKPELFEGLMGVFEDSLPDGWGRLLLDRRATQLGLSSAALTPLDRLTVVGTRSMGALTYEPERALEVPEIIRLSELAREAELVLNNAKGADLDQLIAVGGSPKGARPKVLIQLSPSGEVHAGAKTIEPGFTAWMVKFPAREDHRHSAALEHAYFLMARAAGIDVPRTQLLGRTTKHPGYFAIERFDREGPRRVHMHTLGGMRHLPHGYPALDYADLIKTTRALTRNEAYAAEMFRRACFNVFAHNRDDHSRNFAFLMDVDGAWRPSPAYDLTCSDGPGGEHTMLVAGEGRAPGAEHLEKLAADVELKRSADIVERVAQAVRSFARYADEAGVPAKLRAATAAKLTPPRRRAAPTRRSARPGSARRAGRARA